MKYITTLILFFILLSLNTSAQDVTKADSLKKIVSNGDFHEQVATLNALFDLYINSSPDTAYFYLQKSVKVADENKSQKDKIECYLRLNAWLINKGDYQKANKYLYNVINLAQQIRDSLSILMAENKIAHIFYRYGKYDSALHYSIKAIHLSQQLKNKQGQYDGLNTSGNVYISIGKHNKALECFKQNYNVALQLGDDRNISTVLNNIGLVYQGLQNNKAALDYFLKALPYSKRVAKSWEAASYTNIGLAYEGLEQYDMAREYYQKTIIICKEINLQMGIVYGNNYLGSLAIKTKEYPKAIERLEEALVIAKVINMKPQLNDTYRLLSDAYRGLNDYKKADYYFRLHVQVKDTLMNESTAKQVAELQTKYETETKEKTIELLNKDQKLKDIQIGKQKVVRNYLLGIGLLILLLALVLFKANKNKQKANEILILQKLQITEKNEALNQQNEKIVIQRDLIESQKILVEHQKKEITDSINYAQRIQHAILAPIEEVRKYFPDSFILYKPKDIVSGDFYWFDVKNEICYIAAADCTGHGIPGAMMTMIGTILMNEIVNNKKLELPKTILKELNYLLDITYRQAKIADGMDIALCSFNTKTYELRYAGANRPLYLIRKNAPGLIEEIKANKTAIGSDTQTNYEFTDHSVQLQSGDVFYLASDGYADQFGGEKGKKLTTKKFKDLLTLLKDKPMVEQESFLSSYILNWRNDLEQVDDLLVIGVRV